MIKNCPTNLWFVFNINFFGCTRCYMCIEANGKHACMEPMLLKYTQCLNLNKMINNQSILLTDINRKYGYSPGTDGV